MEERPLVAGFVVTTNEVLSPIGGCMMRQKFALYAVVALLSSGAAPASPIEVAAPLQLAQGVQERRDVREEQRELRDARDDRGDARRDLRHADTPREQRRAVDDLRDARGDVRDERRDVREERQELRDARDRRDWGRGRETVIIRTLAPEYRFVEERGRRCRIVITRKQRANGTIVRTERREC